MAQPEPQSQSLRAFFSPRSVAVVGASARPESVGYAIVENLMFGQRGSRDRAHGFPGQVYAVNAKGGELFGAAMFPSLAAIGAPVDLVVICIPPQHVRGLIDDAKAAGASAAIVISAGFAELGDEGRRLQGELVAEARRHGIRLVGPNCLGVIRPSARLNASFGAAAPGPGRLGVLSQSGALVTGIISYGEREPSGLSAAVSLGAKCDVDDADILDFFADDPETSAVAVYVEGVGDAKRFFRAARALAAKKPVVALKGGTTAAGAKAASSHTGSLAGSQAAFAAACAQAGVQQASTIGEMLSWSRALAMQPPAAGKRIAVVTNAGGPGVLCADLADRLGLEMATLSEATVTALNGVLPAVWSHGNPVDVIGDATPERYRDALDILGRAPEVDGMIVIMTVQAMTAPAAVAEAIAGAAAAPSWTKPLVASFLGLVGTEVGALLDAKGVPELNLPEDAVQAMSALVRRGEWLRRRDAEPSAAARAKHPAPDLEKARALVGDARRAGQTIVDLARSRAILEAAGIRYNRSGVARHDGEAVRIAEGIGWPVVIKLVSPDVVHKSDVGGVVLDVVGPDAVRATCRAIRERVERAQPGARIEGFTIEEQVSGTEIIVGTSRDPSFGTLVMVGMGGIFVEVYQDVAFRVAPVSRRDALEMIAELRAQPLLDGARRRPRVDRDELAELIVRISDLVQGVEEITEIDLNPLVVTEKGLIAIDARVIAMPPGAR